jgi:hypothetical protein
MIKKRGLLRNVGSMMCCVVSIMILWSAFGTVCQGEGPPLEAVYPPPESADDIRDLDAVKLLRTALEKTEPSDGAFAMYPSKSGVMSTARYQKEVQDGVRLNVIWAAVTEELEQDALPVRIPIRKGILGYRIFLIRKQDREKFAKITTLDELKQLTVGQGHGWKDVEVFKANGFPVITGDSYEGLFKMLVNGRFDYFSRGINEAPEEYAARKDDLPDLWVEEHLLLYYPWPKYFFVSKNAPLLADRLERGLNMMIEDGSFDEIFRKYHGASIQAANLKNRRLFTISNPLLPATAPLGRKQLWYTPFK